MLRRILRWIRWAAPPAPFLAWAYRAYQSAVSAAIPAFGPPEPLVAAWRAEMLEQLGLGALLLAIWIACWAWPRPVSVRTKDGPARPVSQRSGGRAREQGRGLT